MQWKNYQQKIIDVHNVHLVGWPDNIPFINELREAELVVMISALENGTCRWERLSSADQLARKAASGKAKLPITRRCHHRKAPSVDSDDGSMPCAKRRKVASAEFVEESDEETMENSN